VTVGDETGSGGTDTVGVETGSGGGETGARSGTVTVDGCVTGSRFTGSVGEVAGSETGVATVAVPATFDPD
jgi:hypothetical protein